jgi:hypothetical protein
MKTSTAQRGVSYETRETNRKTQNQTKLEVSDKMDLI